ncbi:hypothetical protein K505DRAFT_373057 [Melanomma pulvis-pyrius CBS 109.77]|uniref:Rhodopsin domain-containing protein n=1 Tax=Melanomma pulvis-pyrius CBS 109.77 TaxID=1314802 RepID=A0A6A6XL67_9PLEO|nr:hypothetical protein K505DRAFT_373057 [Melanomma pulvis-pyrius CBS 109.77]
MSYPGDRAPGAVRLAGVFMALSVLAVGIRFWSRIITKSRLWWDDWLALAALLLAIAQCVLTIYWTSIGLGKHAKDLPPSHLMAGLKILYANYFLYDVGISLPKLSALFFYARIFRVSQRFAYSLWAVGALVVSWILFAVLSAIWQCKPISRAWDPRVHGTCLDYYEWWLGSAISSVIIDTIILIMPLPSLWKLSLNLGRKLLVVGVLVIAISVGRLVANVRGAHALQLDVTYNIIPIGDWLVAETPISIVSICLPSIFTFVKRGITEGPYSLISTKSGSSLKRLRTPPSAGIEPQLGVIPSN